MLSFEPLHGFVDKMVFEIVEGQSGRGVRGPESKIASRDGDEKLGPRPGTRGTGTKS